MRILALVFGLLFAATAESVPLGNSPFGAVVGGPEPAERQDASAGNRVAMLEGGYDALLLRIHLIRHAQSSIELQTFIWTNDECGRLMMRELIAAAGRGVRVRIIADHLFSEQEPDTAAFLATVHPNLEIKHYRPAMARLKPSRLQLLLSGLLSFRAINQRMHNKVLIVDDAVLVTGGRNIENAYYDFSTGLNFRDRDVLVVGPAAKAAAASFEEFWRFKHAVGSRELRDVADAITANTFRRYSRREDWNLGDYFANLEREADDFALIAGRFVAPLQAVRRAEFICDEPGKKGGQFSKTARITRRLGKSLEQARHRITVQTPYLVLSRPAQELIHRLREKNPALLVRISTNSFASTDNLAAYSANYRLRNNYIENLRLHIYEFMPRPAALPVLFPQHAAMTARARAKDPAAPAPFLSLHAKSLVIDDALAFIGSYNLDPRSENLNTEVGLLIEDEAFARLLRESIDRDMRPENSWVIGRRNIPLNLDLLNSLIDGVLSLTPLDVWPIQNTSSFALRPGGREVPPDSPEFHRNYREVGAFPGTHRDLATKEIVTRLYKAIGQPLTPIL